jgi:hypothetical protein
MSFVTRHIVGKVVDGLVSGQKSNVKNVVNDLLSDTDNATKAKAKSILSELDHSKVVPDSVSDILESIF